MLFLLALLVASATARRKLTTCVNSGLFIKPEWECDGTDDCGDCSDEWQNCCTAGKFGTSHAWSNGGCTCLTCPYGKWTNEDGVNECSPCSETAVPCEPGKFQDTASNDACSCKDCPAGKFQTAGSTNFCSSCPMGKYQRAEGSPTCVSCNAGSFSTQSGSTACISCPSGKYSSSVGKNKCLGCAQGYFTSCSRCPAGKVTTRDRGNTKCGVCGVREFSNAGCTACAAGFFQKSMEKCLLCPAGYFQPDAIQPACIACVAGNFTSTEGREECDICNAGSVTETPGQRRCTQCKPGYFAESTAKCTLCPIGKFMGSNAKTSCGSCHAGSFAEAAGAKKCADCPKGKFTQAFEQGSCDTCAIGLYSVSPLQCRTCPAGKHQHLSEQTSCIFCKKGKYVTASASTLCRLCPSGKYTLTAGRGSCTMCKGGNYASETGQTSCLVCPSNYFAIEGTAVCDTCELGKLAQPGQDTCVDEPEDNSGMILGIALTSTAIFIACCCLGLKRGNKCVQSCATKCIIGGLEFVMSEADQRALVHHVKQHQHHRRLSLIMAANEEEEMRRRDIEEMRDAEEMLNRTVDFMNFEDEAISTGLVPGADALKNHREEHGSEDDAIFAALSGKGKAVEVRNPTKASVVEKTDVIPMDVDVGSGILDPSRKIYNPTKKPRRTQVAPAGPPANFQSNTGPPDI